MDHLEFDVVIVGGGGSGLRAALEVAGHGFSAAVISKVFPTRSHTVAAQGGINAALGNQGEDDWRWHMYDTVVGSDYLGDQDAIEYMCKEAKASVIELEHMGLPFSRDENGRIYQRSFGGQTVHYGGELATRTCCAQDRTGHAMLTTLYQANLKAKTHFLSEWFALDLIHNKKGEVCGLSAIEIATGDVKIIKARAVVLATGGAGKIFASSTNAHSCTGDGMAMALRSGVALQDMEMWQFHPSGLYGIGLLISEGTRGEGGYLINSEGERYMERYAPHLKDLSCRDIVARSSMIEIKEGRGCGPKKDHVLLKLNHLDVDVFDKKLPGITELSITYLGIDPRKEPIPVVPTCHYMMGGIPTNFKTEVISSRGDDSVVEGLFAVGECACVSVHGANRLGANSLLDLVVFGRACGRHIIELLDQGYGKDRITDDSDIERSLSRYERSQESISGENVADVRMRMSQIMQNHFGVFREEKSMLEGLEALKVLRHACQNLKLDDKSKVFNTARLELFELENMIEVAYATACAALERRESRGAHARVDFEKRDDKNWLKHILVDLNGDISYRNINMKPHYEKPMKPKERLK